MAAICVYCSSSEEIDPGFFDLAAAVGDRLAKGGHVLVSGGGRVSMMGALARAARSGGVRTVGVIPRQLTGAERADIEADELIVVETMRERKAIMDARCDAFLALPGGLGTLEELLEVWTAGSLGMHDKPVVVLDVEGVFAGLWRFLAELRGRGFVRQEALDRLGHAASVDEAFDLIERQLGGA